MSARHISAEKLAALVPTASCCDCSREASQAPNSQIWTIWNGSRYYCPACAASEGIGANS